jgi:hypothetical protein
MKFFHQPSTGKLPTQLVEELIPSRVIGQEAVESFESKDCNQVDHDGKKTVSL